MKIKIDEEFRNIIPALTDAEYEQLEQNIIAEGCRDRIITWNGILIDGHNRFSICEKHGVAYEVMAMDHFASRDEVIDWMIHNQIGKRNLSGGTISYLRGLKLKREKLKQLAEQIRDEVESSKEDEGADEKAREAAALKEKETELVETVAKQYRVSPATIKNDERFTNAVDTIQGNVGKKIKDRILNKELKLNPFEVMSISKLELNEQKSLLSGEDEEVIEKISVIKEQKRSENHDKAMIRMDKDIQYINFLLDGPSVGIETGEKKTSLYYTVEGYEDDRIPVSDLKDAKAIAPYLAGFRDAVKMLKGLADEE